MSAACKDPSHLRRLGWRLRHLGQRVGILKSRNFFMVLEYRKCCRTWLRFKIAQAEARAHGLPFEQTLRQILVKRYALPRVEYVHGYSQDFPLEQHHYDCHDTARIGRKPRGVILLTRSPLRQLISSYFHSRFRSQDFSGTFADFIRDPKFGITRYAEYLDYYLRLLQGVPHLIVRYEDLCKRPEAQLAEILDFVSLSLTPGEISEIVAQSSFDAMQAGEREGRWKVPWLTPGALDNPQSFKVRSCGNDDLHTHYTVPDAQYVLTHIRGCDAFRILGYVEEAVRFASSVFEKTYPKGTEQCLRARIAE